MEEGITVFTTMHVCGNGVISPSNGGMFGLPRSIMKWQKREGKTKEERERKCLRACWLCVGA